MMYYSIFQVMITGGLVLLATSSNQLNWSLAGNTKGFGHGINDGRPFWIGNFSGPGRADILFYFPGDDNWWLGTFATGNQLQWTLAGNTKGFGHGINDGRPFWIGDFNGDGRADILFYFPGDDNWWLGTFSSGSNQLNWSLAGNTKGFGHGINDGRPFWIGNFSSPSRADILFYFPGDDNWWLGTFAAGNQLQWKLAGNTKGFGHGINDGRPFWIGNFSRFNSSAPKFYYYLDNEFLPAIKNAIYRPENARDLTKSGIWFKDAQGRYVIFRGVNFAGRAKLAPYLPVAPPVTIERINQFPFFIFKNFPTIDELRLELNKVSPQLDLLKTLGFNIVRLLVIWKALEPTPNPVPERLLPEGEKYLLLYKEIIDILYSRGMFVIIDFHQDIAHEVYNGDGFPDWALALDDQHQLPSDPPTFKDAKWGLHYYNTILTANDVLVRHTLKSFW